MNAHDLTGKTAFVSGAFGGLGLHFARVLAGHGARVALAGRRIELGRTVAAEIGAAVARPGDVRAYRLDVTPQGGVEITGGDAAGVFWGAQTLRQLLGPDAFRRAHLHPGLRGGPAP